MPAATATRAGSGAFAAEYCSNMLSRLDLIMASESVGLFSTKGSLETS